MTKEELLLHPAFNKHSRLHLLDGSSISGVYFNDTTTEPARLVLVPSTNLQRHQQAQQAGDLQTQRSLAVPLDPAQVVRVELLN